MNNNEQYRTIMNDNEQWWMIMNDNDYDRFLNVPFNSLPVCSFFNAPMVTD